jgi:hypothetical protein
MSWSDWIVALFCIGSGVGVVGFWLGRFAARRVALDQHVMRLHVVAEFVTGGTLLAGGIATLVDARAPATLVLVGVALGLLVYASIQSPAFYPDERLTRLSLWGTLIGAVTVIVLRLVTL